MNRCELFVRLMQIIGYLPDRLMLFFVRPPGTFFNPRSPTSLGRSP